jgi:endonuclease YncB( thermonuclease family)
MMADAAAMLLMALAILYGLDKFPQIDFQSSVTVTDGDSLRRGSQRIRLHGIDAPELGQQCRDQAGHSYRCGEEARRILKELVGSPEISCDIIETDRYQRDVARCRVDSVEVNREMVRLGWAVAYGRQNIDYLYAEAQARTAKRGLWQGEFELPEDFRAEHRDAVRRGDMLEPEWLEID